MNLLPPGVFYSIYVTRVAHSLYKVNRKLDDVANYAFTVTTRKHL
jgi:hypothetical protein